MLMIGWPVVGSTPSTVGNCSSEKVRWKSGVSSQSGSAGWGANTGLSAVTGSPSTTIVAST